MDDQITVRRAVAGDLDEILRLTDRLYENETQNYYKGWDADWVCGPGREIVAAGLVAEDNFILVAQTGSRTVGFLRGSLYWDDWMAWKKGKGAELWDIFIEDEFRNRSLGKNMMEMFFSWCRDKQVDYVQLNVTAANEKALEFYKSLGFGVHQFIVEKRL